MHKARDVEAVNSNVLPNQEQTCRHGDDDDISICGNCIEDWTGIRKRKDKIKQKIEVILPIFQVSRRISLMIWIFFVVLSVYLYAKTVICNESFS